MCRNVMMVKPISHAFPLGGERRRCIRRGSQLDSPVQRIQGVAGVWAPFDDVIAG
jgi:hypothetical protein